MIAMRQAFFGILVLAATVGAAVSPAGAQARTALVFGNAAYSFAPLVNPTNDAQDVAAALRGAGFEVILNTDSSQSGMTESIQSFGATLKAKGGVGLFFFAGHGVQHSGENYIIPIGDGIASEADLKNRAIAMSEVVDTMAAASNGLNIVILDACRDNPLRQGSTGGLSRIDTNARLFVSYSTSPGAVALDGTGRNSPYAKHLAGALRTAGLNLEETFKRTLKGVYQETKGQQTPWISSSFFGDFVFRSGGVTTAAVGIPRNAPTQLAAVPPTFAGIYRADGTNPNGSRYRGMVALTQTGDQFNVKWWIAKQIFTGTGHLAGRLLVVNWGAKHPVIYGFGDGSVLDGEWADGSATERLQLYSRASAEAVATPQGRYRVSGRNANGSGYSG
ncbi:MAG: caspase family protein, partial [Proteobacteria bacterium]|nr:caspase family protein [Pseudomonadota bacterium]